MSARLHRPCKQQTAPMESALSWMANAIVILVMPVRLGMADASLLLFAGYCLLCSVVLTLAEDWRYLGAAATRPDVRGYMAARSAITALFGSDRS